MMTAQFVCPINMIHLIVQKNTISYLRFVLPHTIKLELVGNHKVVRFCVVNIV